MLRFSCVCVITILAFAREDVLCKEGKKTQEPLSLTLKVEKPRGVLGEYFLVYVTIRNNGKEVIYLPMINSDSVRIGEFVFFDIQNHNKQKISLCRFGTGANSTEIVRPLKPGSEITHYYTLSDTYRMAEVGTYVVKATLLFHPHVPVVTEDRRKIVDHWKGELNSDPVTITVTEPQGVDKEVSMIVIDHKEKILHLPDFGHLYDKYSKSQYFKYWAFLHAEMLADNFDKPSQGQNKALPWYKKVVDDYEVYELTDNAELAIARIYLLQGKKEEAVQQFRRVLELYPDTDSVSEAKKALKELQSK